MKVLLLVGVAMGLLVTSASAATTVKGSKSNSDNKLKAGLASATVTLSAASETKTVYRTPAAGDFLLTHICVSPAASGGMLLSADGLGAIAHLGGAESCATFTPGVLLPPNANLTCSTFASAAAGSYFCTISGLLAPPPLPPRGRPWGAP